MDASINRLINRLNISMMNNRQIDYNKYGWINWQIYFNEWILMNISMN